MAENNKRSRNEEDEAEETVSSPEVKRIRADLFEIFEDESEPVKGIDDLDSVMRSFEEEIATLSSPASVVTPERNPRQPDLGFLLEASDDELGLPPAGGDGDVIAGGTGDGDVAEAVGFGKIWGLDDEIHLDYGFGSEEGNNGADYGSVILDGDLFDCGTEFDDLTWRPEFTPAA